VQQKVYRREEDPEIAERQAQDLENAEKAGLVASSSADQDEEAPKAVSLKERIALLQKQQAEQAARRDVSAKEKPKRPPKKRSESQAQEDAMQEGTEPQSADLAPRESFEFGRESQESARRPPKVPRPSESAPREMPSDGNDADQSGAGETTEEAEGTSGSVEDENEAHVNPPARNAAPARPGVEDENESEGDEDLDEETRNQMALRERMAKLSGGMGMGAMFGPRGGMPMMGMGGGSKKKAPERSFDEPEPTPMAQAPRVPVIPVPGLNRTMSVESNGEEPAEIQSRRNNAGAFRSVPATPQGTFHSLQIRTTTTRKPVETSHSSEQAQTSKALPPRTRKYRSESYAVAWILSSLMDFLVFS
jgi:hypothetical protein